MGRWFKSSQAHQVSESKIVDFIVDYCLLNAAEKVLPLGHASTCTGSLLAVTMPKYTVQQPPHLNMLTVERHYTRGLA